MAKWTNLPLTSRKLITKEEQIIYFDNVVNKLFSKLEPDQILFSFLINNNCVGYGGLVHISWINMTAEVSFIMDTNLESKYFQKYWVNFLKLIESIAFNQLNFNKLYTYAFDLRPNLYKILEFSGYIYSSTLKNQFFKDSKLIDVVIHHKINNWKIYFLSLEQIGA